MIAAIIPARFASTRFPGKPLALLRGKPMILWVVEKTLAAGCFDRVVVATDDERIAKVVREAGYQAEMTDPAHVSGTDRVYEVARRMVKSPQDLIVNVQGDEPLVDGNWLKLLVSLLQSPEAPDWATLAHVLEALDLSNPNAVKVLCNEKKEAIYFSRFPLPFSRALPSVSPTRDVYKHVGLYGYRWSALERFCAAKPCLAEESESLEQLRALHLGMKIRVGLIEGRSQGVDTPQDLEKIEHLLGGRA